MIKSLIQRQFAFLRKSAFLAISAVLLLSGCKTAPTTPVLPDAYEAPRVDCTQQQTADTPAWPVLWWLDGPSFAITVLGILAQERDLRGREHACVQTHKDMGIIR